MTTASATATAAPGDFDPATFAAAPPTAPDPRSASSADDLSAFRLDPIPATMLTAKPTLSIVPVRKPGKTQWAYRFPDDEWTFTAAVLENEIDGSVYLMSKAIVDTLAPEVAELVKPVCLAAYTDRQGVISLWPVPLPGADGSSNSWHESARDIAFNHSGEWLRVRSSRGHSAYLMTKAPVVLPPPSVPEVAMLDLLRIAFKGKQITTPDHQVLRQLRGEV